LEYMEEEMVDQLYYVEHVKEWLKDWLIEREERTCEPVIGK